MRQRIVINLDGPKTEGAKTVRKRRRWPRVLGILALLVLIGVVVAAIGGFLWWRHYQSTPTYTLALILDAAQRNDLAEFQKRIDDDEIARNMAASISQKAASRYGLSLNSSVQQRIESTMPSLLPRVKQTIHDEVFQVMKQFAITPEQRSFISIIGLVQSLMTVVTEGDTAKATGAMAGHTIELTMRRDADRWKVTEVKDDAIVQRVVDSLMKELPPIGEVDANSLKKSLLLKPRRRGQR
jgi:hypothetical protein